MFIHLGMEDVGFCCPVGHSLRLLMVVGLSSMMGFM
jgi:hypothetical protein